MKPAAWSTRAISSFSRDFGMRTRRSRARPPLRMRVNMSAIGALVTSCSSPARLGHAGDLPLERELAQADPAQVELAVVGARAAAAAAAVVVARAELELAARSRHAQAPLLVHLGSLGHEPLRSGTACRG